MPFLPRYTLLPYTTLFRSGTQQVAPRQLMDRPGLPARTPLREVLRPPNGRSRTHPVHAPQRNGRSEEYTSELQSPCNLVCRLLLEKTNRSDDRFMFPLNLT